MANIRLRQRLWFVMRIKHCGDHCIARLLPPRAKNFIRCDKCGAKLPHSVVKRLGSYRALKAKHAIEEAVKRERFRVRKKPDARKNANAVETNFPNHPCSVATLENEMKQESI